MALAHSPRIITDGLVLCLDTGNTKSYSGSGTTWSDLSGNSNNGTLVNGVGYDSGNAGSLTFDGTNDYATIDPQNSTTNGLYFGGATSISVSTWVKINNTNIFKTFVIYEDIANGDIVEPIRFYLLTDNTVGFSIVLSNGSNDTAISSTTLNTSDWYYLTGTFGDGYIKIYVNGVFENQTSLSGSIKTPNSGINAAWNIGSGELTQSSRYINGNIAQVSIYNRALTASEVAQNYNALKGRYV